MQTEMASFKDNIVNRVYDCLANQSLEDRLIQLTVLLDHCNLRELQEVFPSIVSSIFGVNTGGLGWGLRTITATNSIGLFRSLCRFFAPSGYMFKVCYRLLHDATKFEFSLELLPPKVAEMLTSGQYSIFYADLLNIDTFRRQVTSLLLNPFDYYILHFVIHATYPLHKMYPAALQIHNERLKSVYFHLTLEYLYTFLPGSPDAIIYPTNVSTTVKAPQPMPTQSLQAPKRTPKYLKISTSNAYVANNSVTTQNVRNTDWPRAHSWRSETVLHFFLDTWMRYDMDNMRDLPSSEYIRVVRILVKQIHCFASSIHLDQTNMVILRKAGQSMLKAHIYGFLRSVISRWPLDSSLAVVVELWLSYIQPWHYSFEVYNIIEISNHIEVAINSRYDSFIADNLIVYTQIFVLLLRRFIRLDFSSYDNVTMLYRLSRVLCQSHLPKKLYLLEQSFNHNTLDYDSPQRQTHSTRLNSTPVSSDWDSVYHEECYVPLFGQEVKVEMEQFLKSCYTSLVYVQNEIAGIKKSINNKKNSMSFLRKLFARIFVDVSPAEIKLEDMEKIPAMLECSINTLSLMFGVKVSIVESEETQYVDESYRNLNFTLYDNSDYLDLSRMSPSRMRQNLAIFNNTIDPAVIPIQWHECKFLVRLLHHVSCKLNEMFGEELQNIYQRNDYWGKLAKLLLYEPMISKWFDKPRGVTELCEAYLPPRLGLRPLASYRVLALVMFAFIIGQVLWNAPSYGLLTLLLMVCIYFFILALIS